MRLQATVVNGYIYDNHVGLNPALNLLFAMLTDLQLYITQFKHGYFSRPIALVASIHRAMITSPEPLPNM